MSKVTNFTKSPYFKGVYDEYNLYSESQPKYAVFEKI